MSTCESGGGSFSPAFLTMKIMKSMKVKSVEICVIRRQHLIFYMSYMPTCKCGGGSFRLQPSAWF